MSAVISGRRLYGQVDRVPGLCYVSTVFWHVQYIPLAPLRSYIVLEGSEKGEDFRGVPISLQPKSVVVGYLRGWLGATAFFTALVSGFAISAFFLGHRDTFAVLCALAAGAVLAGAVWFVITARGPLAFLAQCAFHGLALLVWFGYSRFIQPNPAPFQGKAPELSCWPYLAIANGALFLYSLTRLWTRASSPRAAILADELALDEECRARKALS